MFIPKSFHTFGIRDLVNEFIPEDELEDFATWAFGENFNDLDGMIEFAQSWNRLHGEMYKIKMDSPIVDDIYKMTQLYLIHKGSDI